MLLGFLSACGMSKIDRTKNWSASKLYAEARDELNSGGYEQAIEYYEKLQARYPYSKQARQAEIETIYAYYKYGELESAIASADRFISEHPDHPHLDYVYYMRGIVNYDTGQDLMSKLFPQNPAERDPKSMREAFKYFSELVQRFPNSKYSQDAFQRMIYTRNKLAERELHIARFYMERGSWVAAVNRAKTVVENYQKTTAVPEALHILRESYTKLGMRDLANDYARIIQANNMQKYKKVTKVKPPGILESLLKIPSRISDAFKY